MIDFINQIFNFYINLKKYTFHNKQINKLFKKLEPNIFYFAMRFNLQKKINIQDLLDEQMLLQGQLTEIQQQIEIQEIHYLSNSWTTGNILIGWPRNQLSQNRIALQIQAKDKKFSLSSIFSRASLELMNIEDKKLTSMEKLKFQKKKKPIRKKDKNRLSRRGKGKAKKK